MFMAGRNLDPCLVGVSLSTGCPLSLVQLMICMDRISWHSSMGLGDQFGDPSISFLQFTDNVVLLSSPCTDVQLSLQYFSEQFRGGLRWIWADALQSSKTPLMTHTIVQCASTWLRFERHLKKKKENPDRYWFSSLYRCLFF